MPSFGISDRSCRCPEAEAEGLVEGEGEGYEQVDEDDDRNEWVSSLLLWPVGYLSFCHDQRSECGSKPIPFSCCVCKL